MEKVPFGKFGFIHKSASDWMHERRNTIIVVGIGILTLAIWTFYKWNSGSTRDYTIAEKTFNEWSGDINEKFVQLQKILKHHPELHAKYDGVMAQKLLISSHQGLAASLSQATQKRIGELSPHYALFSKCSLVIGEKKFDEALQQAKALKETLQQDENFWKSTSEVVKHGTLLYGYTLLRIAFLEQKMGNPSGEKAAWNEFKKEAGWLEKEPAIKRIDPESLNLICQNFQKNDVSLKDFIQHRESCLNLSK